MIRNAGVLVSLLIVGVACAKSSTSSPSTNTDAGTATDTDAGTATDTDAGPQSASLAGPPAPGAPAAPDGTGSVTFAIDHLFSGDTDPDGTPDRANGWTHYGYNIDGVGSTDPNDFCLPRQGARATTVHQKGVNGIQNSYGHMVLPITLGISPDAPSKVNAAFAAGGSTILISINNLGMSANDNPLVANIYQGDALGKQPAYDGTDQWPVLPGLLNDPSDLSKGSSAQVTSSYLVNDSWVSAQHDGMLKLPRVGSLITVPISHVIVTMQLDATHTHATNGIISGIIPVEQLETQLRQQAGMIDPSLCSGPTIDSIMNQIEQAADIMQDGTQDPTKECDGISIGLGFTASQVQLGAIAPAPPPPMDPCAGM